MCISLSAGVGQLHSLTISIYESQQRFTFLHRDDLQLIAVMWEQVLIDEVLEKALLDVAPFACIGLNVLGDPISFCRTATSDERVHVAA